MTILIAVFLCVCLLDQFRFLSNGKFGKAAFALVLWAFIIAAVLLTA